MGLFEGAHYARQCAMNAELVNRCPYGGKGRDEKAALKRAEAAERAFRASKGYEPDTVWNRLKARFRKK